MGIHATDADRERLANTVQDSWRLLMTIGVVLILLGAPSILTPLFTGLTLSFLLGIYLVVGGLSHFVHVFSGRDWKGVVVQLVLAVVFVVAGLALAFEPAYGLFTLTLLLVGFFLADGVVEVVMGVRMRPEGGWGWVVASGVVSMLVAGLLWAGFPSDALWAVGVLFGVALLSSGVSLIVTAMGGRAAARRSVGPVTGTGG